MTSLTFKLPTALRVALEEAASAEGRTLSDFIRRHFSHLIRQDTRPAKAKKKGGAK